jgi:hypothetical protein
MLQKRRLRTTPPCHLKIKTTINPIVLGRTDICAEALSDFSTQTERVHERSFDSREREKVGRTSRAIDFLASLSLLDLLIPGFDLSNPPSGVPP